MAFLLAAAALTACGDAPTNDDRQWYTKAPLEEPGLTITAEEPSEMAELGEPDIYGRGAPEAESDDGAGPTVGGEAAADEGEGPAGAAEGAAADSSP
ncbi:MAG TPA: hypothetical protein VK837_10950 [Longimicrobiales bacterium]|nr:hypothetical protein [Longimicrobiales bacterium]